MIRVILACVGAAMVGPVPYVRSVRDIFVV